MNVGTSAPFQNKDDISRYGISIIKIRRSHDCLIFIIGMPILIRRRLYIETAPNLLWVCISVQNADLHVVYNKIFFKFSTSQMITPCFPIIGINGIKDNHDIHMLLVCWAYPETQMSLLHWGWSLVTLECTWGPQWATILVDTGGKPK